MGLMHAMENFDRGQYAPATSGSRLSLASATTVNGSSTPLRPIGATIPELCKIPTNGIDQCGLLANEQMTGMM